MKKPKKPSDGFDLVRFCDVLGYPCSSAWHIRRAGQKLSFCGRKHACDILRQCITWQILWADPPQDHVCHQCREIYYFKKPQVTKLVIDPPAIYIKSSTPKPLDCIPDSPRALRP